MLFRPLPARFLTKTLWENNWLPLSTWHSAFRPIFYSHITIVEESKITNLLCYQNTLGERQITCGWIANPIAQIYEIVFTNLDNSKNFKKNVSKKSVSVEFDVNMGNIIGISVNNVLTKVMLKGESLFEFLTTKHAHLICKILYCYRTHNDIFCPWLGMQLMRMY